MDISKPFSFAFGDNQWVNKLGLGALITLIPVLNFAWTGYMVELMRNVMKDAPQLLPSRDDLSRKFNEGLHSLSIINRNQKGSRMDVSLFAESPKKGLLRKRTG